MKLYSFVVIGNVVLVSIVAVSPLLINKAELWWTGLIGAAVVATIVVFLYGLILKRIESKW